MTDQREKTWLSPQLVTWMSGSWGSWTGRSPELYAALDVFAFPSPVETQGLVALEANCCGTPVAGVDAGALSDTVHEGETGYSYPEGDLEEFRRAIERVLDEQETLSERCLARRDSVSVEHAVGRLQAVYADVLDAPRQ
ncbi:glycosyltransferase [Halomicroarcula sp. GCM10025710]